MNLFLLSIQNIQLATKMNTNTTSKKKKKNSSKRQKENMTMHLKFITPNEETSVFWQEKTLCEIQQKYKLHKPLNVHVYKVSQNGKFTTNHS